MEQRHAPPAGHQQIGPTVTVVVGHSRAVGVKARLIETDLVGDVVKMPISKVLVQPAGMAADLLPFEITSARHEDVEQAVAIVIEKRNAAAERLQDRVVIGLFAIAIREMNPRLLGHVVEPRV